MYLRRTNRPKWGFIILGVLILAIIGVSLYWWQKAGGALPSLPQIGSGGKAAGDLAKGVSDVNGVAHVDYPGGSTDFQVLSGMSGERLPGVTISIAASGSQRLFYAEDPSGIHVPVAGPLGGDSTVRRLIMPPRGSLNYNITTASGSLDLGRLKRIGTLNEGDIRDLLKTQGDRAVLIYLYDYQHPLALTGAPLEAYATPFENVTVLRPDVDDPDLTSMVLVGINRPAYDTWAHLAVDRYLSGRVGQLPGTDLAADLSFGWAYPVFDVYPPDESLNLGTGDTVTLRVSWRSQNPDPPPPWSFFISSSDEGRVVMSPESFPLSPETPPQEVTLTINRSGLAVGEHSVKVYIQPFSEAFGMIQQTVEREINFTVAEIPPTPTAGPAIGGLTYSPENPREGQTLSVSASGFKAGEPVTVDFTGTDKTLHDEAPVAASDGSFSYTIDLSTVPAGDYTLRLTGSQSGVSGEASITVLPGIADAVVTSNELNLRTKPEMTAPVLEILVKGDELKVISVNGDDSWYEVISKGGNQGWVDARRIQLNIDPSSVPWNQLYPAP